jgi:hypothetical protein
VVDLRLLELRVIFLARSESESPAPRFWCVQIDARPTLFYGPSAGFIQTRWATSGVRGMSATITAPVSPTPQTGELPAS